MGDNGDGEDTRVEMSQAEKDREYRQQFAANKQKLRVVGKHEHGQVEDNQEAEDWNFIVGSEYDIDRIYTRAADKRGHKDTVHVPISPGMYGSISHLVSLQVVPGYRSVQDFIRDAIVHRLRYMNEQVKDGRIRSELTAEMMLAELEMHQRQMADLNAVVEGTEALLKAAVESKDAVRVEELLDKGTAAMEKLVEPYKGKLRKVLERYDNREHEVKE